LKLLKTGNLRWIIMVEVILLLGSNCEPENLFMDNAVDLIQKKTGKILKIGNRIITKPYGIKEQKDFHNQLIKIQTLLTPHELLREIKLIETEVGRSESQRWGEREIDIDIIFYDKIKMESPILTIPHPQVYKRDFVKKMLKEFL